MGPVATLLSIEEYEQLPEDDGLIHELLEGELLVCPRPVAHHTLLARKIERVLEPLEDEGFLCCVEPGLRLGPKTVLGPDLCVFRSSDTAVLDDKGWFVRAPLLAVEVISPSNTAEEIERKVRAYLGSGVQEVWVFYPRTSSVRVHRRGDAASVVFEAILETALFPGLKVNLPELFA